MKRVIPLLLAVLLSLLLPFRKVEASSITGTVSLFCENWYWSEHTTTFDRNVTGGGDLYELTITDSLGTVVYYESYPADLGEYHSDAATRSYTTLPAPGTITFVIKSVAGGGYEEQIMQTQTGECEGDGPTNTPPPTFTPSNTPTPTPTATFTATPGPSPTPTATATATANYILRITQVFGEQSYDVALRMEVTPADYVMIGFQVVIVGLLMTFLFVFVRRPPR